MVHKNTELLTDYWRARLPAFGSPLRSSIDPTEFLPLLPQVMILGRSAPGRYGFRLAGGLLADLHGPSVQGADFLPLWLATDRISLQTAMEGAARRSQPLMIRTLARTAEGAAADLEILLAPLTGISGAVDRFLGLYQPVTSLSRLQGGGVVQLVAKQIMIAGGVSAGQTAEEAPRLRLAAMDGRRIA